MKFSIITPLYNKEQYFSETAHSVLGQSLGDWEWIIIDDGSTDSGLALASSFADEDNRIKVFTQENSGPCTARNRGINNAEGEWILFLDADDLLETNCLSGWADLIRENPGVNLHSGYWLEVDAEAQTTVGTHQPAGFGESDPYLILLDAAIAYAPWHPAAAVVKRHLLSADCRWPEEMNRLVTEDTVFWWRLITRNRVALHRHCGVRYRRGTPGCRDQYRDPVRWSAGLFYALESNVSEWVALGHSLTFGQVANLVRTYESFGLEAQQAGMSTIANKSFQRADDLLALGIWKGSSATVRRLLGTRHFQRIRNGIHYPLSTYHKKPSA